MEDRESLRASDKDREAVAERLREALTEGRLNFDEYDDRLKMVYSAKTYGDLKAPLADLPQAASVQASQIVPAPQAAPRASVVVGQPPRGTTTQWIAGQWSGWVTMSMIIVVIWLLSSGSFLSWPIYPIAILGGINLAKTINGVASGAPRRSWEREQRKEAERAARRAKREAERGGWDPWHDEHPAGE